MWTPRSARSTASKNKAPCTACTQDLGYHPLLAARADTREVLAARMRKGSAGSSRGVERFVDELVANLRRAGATGPTTVRADSGFWSRKLIDRLDAHNINWSILDKKCGFELVKIAAQIWVPGAFVRVHKTLRHVQKLIGGITIPVAVWGWGQDWVEGHFRAGYDWVERWVCRNS